MEILKLGPIGKHKLYEKTWEETGRDQISHIYVGFDACSVTSIQFGYVENGALVLSKKHGSGSDYDSTRIVKLNHESEFVTGISGEIYLDCFISSLTFHTNERNHEAFHVELKRYPPRWSRSVRMEFQSGIHDRREFGGFFGSYFCSSLTSIGLYIKPVVISGVHSIKHENV